MKKLLSALVLLALCSGFAMADVPDQTKCNVDPADALHGVIICEAAPAPLAETINLVTVRNGSNQVIANASVVFQFGAAVLICPTAVHTGTTNASGQCTITLSGGGCLMGAGACVVKANGVTIRDFTNVKSPDWDSVQADGSVAAGDYAQFAPRFNQGIVDACFDYDNSGGAVGSGDYSIFARAFNRASHCP